MPFNAKIDFYDDSQNTIDQDFSARPEYHYSFLQERFIHQKV